MSKMCGGLADVKPVDDEIKTMCKELKEEVQQKTGKTFDKFEPLFYKSQVVAGTNYFVKIAVDDSNKGHIHVRIFKPLPYTKENPSVSACQTSKSLDDDVDYF